MDILDRRLGHDAWTTRQLLLRYRELTDEQLDRRFDIGVGSLHGTFLHIIENTEIWTELMAGRPVGRGPEHGIFASAEGLLDRLPLAAKELAGVTRHIRDEGRLDWMFTDTGEEPPIPRPLEQLRLTRLPEGDPLDWEHKAFGWRSG